VRSLDEGDLTGLAGPPRSFFVWPLVGAGLAALLLLSARRWRRAYAAATHGLDSAHVGEGRCKMDGRFVFVSAATALPVGPVVLRGPALESPAYRDNAADRFDTAEPGTLADEARSADDAAAGLRALALASVWFGLVPLGLAALRGIH